MSELNRNSLSSLHNILLVIDDDDENQRRFAHALKGEGKVLTGTFVEAALIAKNISSAVVILGNAGENAVALIEKINTSCLLTKILVIVHGDIDRAVCILKAGAYGIIEDPFNDEILRLMIHRSRHLIKLENDLERLKIYERREGSIFGENPQILHLLKMLDKIAVTEINVLILGESGTGKALFARAIHDRSQRSSQPFITVNCALLPDHLLESELFGFTNRGMSHLGKIELAKGGTLFLDEISELSPYLQTKIYQFFQAHCIKNNSMDKNVFLDIKIISATREDLAKKVLSHDFREDLFQFLAGFSLHIPSLRDRRDDVLLLAKKFMFQYNQTMGRNISGFTDDAIEAMIAHYWAGNVRELQNKIKSAIILTDDILISAKDLFLSQENIKDNGLPINLRQVREDAEKQVVLRALTRAKGNISQSATLLGISRPTLYILIEKYSINR